MKNRKSIWLQLFPIFVCAAVTAGCSAGGGEVYSQSGLSRSYVYIVLPEAGDRYSVETAVGGEHMNVQRLWVFRDQEYVIGTSGADDSVQLSVGSEDPGVIVTANDDVGTYQVKTDLNDGPLDAMVDISQVAQGFGEYELFIERVRWSTSEFG